MASFYKLNTQICVSYSNGNFSSNKFIVMELVFINGMGPETFLQSRIKLRLQVEIHFHIQVVIFFSATFCLHQVVAWNHRSNDMFKTLISLFAQECPLITCTERQGASFFLWKHPLKLAHALHARLALLGVVVLTRAALSAVDSERRSVEAIIELSHPIKEISYHLK